MTALLHFRNVVARTRAGSVCRIIDFQIRRRECCVIYGLDRAVQDSMILLATGTTISDEGVVSVFGTDAQECDEASWFNLVEKIAVLDPAVPLYENASIGENLAAVFMTRDPLLVEPALSRKVLWLSDLVKLTITELAKTVRNASQLLRLKTQLARVLALRPRVLFAKIEELDPETKRILPSLIRRVTRKLGLSCVVFTADDKLAEEIADRVLFLHPEKGDFIENRLRRWYHFLPVIRLSRKRRLELSADIAKYKGETSDAQRLKIPGG